MGNHTSTLRKAKDVNNRDIQAQDTFRKIMVEYQDSAAVAEITATLNTKREFHNDETSTYWLPKDDKEQMRLTGQHFIFKELFGGNVLPRVSEVLDFEKGATILDVGCGSGVWVMDMIHDHPNCTYYGCDIADTVNKKMDYKQFTFTCANVTKRLPYEDNTFDLVHMRLFIAALREDEWPAAINEVLRVTKPGGMIQLMEYDPKLPKDPTNIFYKTVTAFRNICESRGQNPNIGGELVSLLSKYECLKIIQSEYKAIDMSSGTPMAKRLIWDVIEAFKSMQHVMGPIVGVKSNEIGQFLIDYEHSLQTKESFICFSCVAVQKL